MNPYLITSVHSIKAPFSFVIITSQKQVNLQLQERFQLSLDAKILTKPSHCRDLSGTKNNFVDYGVTIFIQNLLYGKDVFFCDRSSPFSVLQKSVHFHGMRDFHGRIGPLAFFGLQVL